MTAAEQCPDCPAPLDCLDGCRAVWDSRARRAQFDRRRSAAERHRCPYCHAEPGDTCRNSSTGEPLTCYPAHPARSSAQPEATQGTLR